MDISDLSLKNKSMFSIARRHATAESGGRPPFTIASGIQDAPFVPQILPGELDVHSERS